MKTQKGQALILIALAMVAMVGLVALAIDGGNTYSARRNAQNAADAGALAAALDMAQGKTDVNTIKNTAKAAALASGLDGNSDVTVVVNYPPVKSTKYQGDKEYIEVIVTTSTNTYFGGLVGMQKTNNTVISVTRGRPGKKQTLFDGAAIVALKPNDTGFRFNGTADLTTKGGGIFVNSTSKTDAMIVSGNTTFKTDSGSTVMGGVRVNGNPTLTTLDGTAPAPIGQLKAAAPRYQEPFSDFTSKVPAIPAAPSCPGPNNPNPTTNGKGELVYPPGTYSNISISNSIGTRFTGGTYCFNGGINFNGGSGPVVSDGPVKMVLGGDVNLGALVMDDLEIYTTTASITGNGSGNKLIAKRFRFYSAGSGTINLNGQGYFMSDNSFIYVKTGQIHWNGNSQVKLIAPPADDPFAGLNIYLPWDNTAQLIINGGSNVQIVGTILAPHAEIQLNGSAGFEAMRSQIIGYTVTIDGGVPTYVNYSDADNFGQPVPAIVELTK